MRIEAEKLIFGCASVCWAQSTNEPKRPTERMEYTYIYTYPKNVINNTKCDVKGIKGIQERKWERNIERKKKKNRMNEKRERAREENVLIFNSPHTPSPVLAFDHTHRIHWIKCSDVWAIARAHFIRNGKRSSPSSSSRRNLCLFFWLSVDCGSRTKC